MYPDNYSLTAVPTQENTRIYALTPHSNKDTLSVKPDIKVTATWNYHLVKIFQI